MKGWGSKWWGIPRGSGDQGAGWDRGVVVREWGSRGGGDQKEVAWVVMRGWGLRSGGKGWGLRTVVRGWGSRSGGKEMGTEGGGEGVGIEKWDRD